MVTWIDALSRTRQKIAGAIGRVFSRSGSVDQASLEELEATLIQADVPVKIASAVIRDFGKGYKGLDVPPKEMLKSVLVHNLGPAPAFSWAYDEKPRIILVVGINGSGKTTTCAKLAYQAQRAGLKPLLGAGDTFRAAGSDQLRLWADKIGCDVVVGATGADTAAVAFDAVSAAMARGADALIMDTAGRMHTKAPLMQELQKVRRAMAKGLANAPHETWIVLDASMGQNAIAQARMFHEASPLTGAIIAKLDGSAKAGFLFAIQQDLNVPIRFVGLGEGMDDLAPFEPEAFVSALLGFESVYS